MSERPALPGDPSLPPGVTLRDIEGPSLCECPVCEGQGWLVVCDSMEGKGQWRERCRRCVGEGVVEEA